MLDLTLNHGKGSLLLPQGAPQPSRAVALLFPKGFKFRTDGVVIGGAPVGTDKFTKDFMQRKLQEGILKLNAIRLMGLKSPRAAHRLLTSCATKYFQYVAGLVPPQLAHSALQEYDQALIGTFMDVLDITPQCCSDPRMIRALAKLKIPPPFGVGLYSTVDHAAIAWWSSVQSCLQDPLVFSLRKGLHRFVHGAWSMISESLGGVASDYYITLSHLLPPSPEGLLDGTMQSPESHSPCKLLKPYLKTLSRLHYDQYTKLTALDQVGDSFTSRGQLPV